MRRKWAHVIEGKGPALLPKIYTDTWKPLRKPWKNRCKYMKAHKHFWKIQWTRHPTIKLYG